MPTRFGYPRRRAGYDDVDFSTLQGLTLISAVNIDDSELRFVSVDGRKFRMLHHQNCCESVSIESIVGDLTDLLHTPILLAEEVSNANEPQTHSITTQGDECEEWTFYKLRTIKGSVDIRWYGTSNGYYSMTASFEEWFEADPEFQ